MAEKKVKKSVPLPPGTPKQQAAALGNTTIAQALYCLATMEAQAQAGVFHKNCPLLRVQEQIKLCFQVESLITLLSV